MISAPPRVWRAALVLPLAAVLVLTAGCGGGAGSSGAGPGATPKAGSDEAEITELARFVVTAQEGAEVCSTRLTATMVRTVFGDLKTCEAPDENDDPADTATGATVTEIKVDGDAATAVVTEQGGIADGSTGTWAFARDGEGWRVDDWRADYLRSGFKAIFGPNYKPDGPDDPFADAEVRGCSSDAIQALPEAEFLTLARGIFAETKASEKSLTDIVLACFTAPSKADGISAIRRSFEEALTKAAGPDLAPAVLACLIQELRTIVTDQDLSSIGERQLRGEGSGQAPFGAEVQAQIEAATKDCLTGDGGTPA